MAILTKIITTLARIKFKKWLFNFGMICAKKILAFHQKLIDIAADFKLPIISIRSDGAAAEFQTQNLQVDR
ncbi:hypothetical protein RhiirA5_433526 [Rhizophagus irregularis]|uniref:Uncharacterized protein n=1 Tax=Rhizophagus irregularis TaxID=588596 RepID=A0A2I1FGU9_9GLOM|nr:hypothetical protein RhiirA5_433526 [Rhizophagus irregularis]PKY33558.1 hypothetical protein RhiirB3_452544 [Rhizophagus irregularis]